MATRRSPFRSLARLAAAAAALVACGCDPSSPLDLHTTVTVEVRPAPAAPVAAPAIGPAPSPASSIVIVPPPPRDLSGPPRLELSERRYAGGRPIRWWSDRLASLRREGPKDLYDLTLARARLCGLAVEEGPGGEVVVNVSTPGPTAAATRPETRP